MIPKCQDCKHYLLDDKCKYTYKHIGLFYSAGESQPSRWTSTLRGGGILGLFCAYLLGMCGPQGRFFEKEEEVNYDG